ncbi:EcsC protein family protein [Anaerotignum neopropionicum]|uniref:EcsC protein family protein n=1 Tax=Anaerotignum neopropionicum TaxID=36847 RepID=A0A136WBD7_9FIRM|nr:EcsC family protein [Anaerotignum neopropionicum]KXL51756.1 EcsC protein family protein [Anaerotignum neopropionicum]
MARSLEKEWERLQKKEEKVFIKMENEVANQNFSELVGIKQAISEKIPDKLVILINEGFQKAFRLVFSKGIGIIEKTYRKDEIALEFEVNDFRMNQRPNSKSLTQLEKQVKRRQRINTCATVTEGIGLGAVGVGLPDIPLFLGILLKGIYETSIGYGYHYNEEKEQILILKMITAALSEKGKMRTVDKDVEIWLSQIDSGNVSDMISLDEEIKKASNALSQALLLPKFLQGFFLVGIVGGIANPIVYQKVMKYVTLKYKKRYLNQKRLSIKKQR